MEWCSGYHPLEDAKQLKHSAAVIAQWFHPSIPSCGPGSNPKHTIYAFSTCIIEIVMSKGRK